MAQKKTDGVRYVPLYPKAQGLDDKFHYYEEIVNEETEEVTKFLRINNEGFRLITSIEELKEFAKTCVGKVIGVDTETTGLTYYKDKIVGFSISLDSYSGVYIPIRHEIKRVTTRKQDRRDEDGNIVYTKAGRPSQQTVKDIETFPSEANLDPKEALDIFYDILLNAKRSLAHNAEFDMNMIKCEGYDIQPLRFFDTIILPYVYDVEAVGYHGLKFLTKHMLGRDVPEFKDTLKGEANFAFTDPTESYFYASYDSANVLGIYEKLFKLVSQLIAFKRDVLVLDGQRYNILQKDNQFVKAFVDYYGHAEILIDRASAIVYKEKLVKEITETKTKIYEYFNVGQFNLSPSSKEFRETMLKAGINTGQRSEKTKAISYNAKAMVIYTRSIKKLKECLINWNTIHFFDTTLDYRKSKWSNELSNILMTYGTPYFNIIKRANSIEVRGKNKFDLTREEFFSSLKEMYKKEKGKIDILTLTLKHNSLGKALNSYVEKLTQVDSCKMRYRLRGTKSGRLSSGNGSSSDKRKNHYYIDLNAQNLTKPASCYYKVEKVDREGDILGYTFSPVTPEYMQENKSKEWFVEGMDNEVTIRSCLKCPKGRYILSCDYSQQENIAMATLSRDNKMMDNFLKGLDSHTATAHALFGNDTEITSKLRKKAKGFNFAKNYGGGANTIAQSLDIPLEEAKEMERNYEETFFEMVQWKKTMISKMYSDGGVVFNAFGRPRQFKGWFEACDNYGSNYYDYADKCKRTYLAQNLMASYERMCISHIIQGCCGDILRYVMLKLYEKFFRNRDSHIDFLSTVHDEINFTVDKDKVVEYAREVQDLMYFDTLDKRLPIKAGIELSHQSYGKLFPFVWKDESRTELVPDRI